VEPSNTENGGEKMVEVTGLTLAGSHGADEPCGRVLTTEAERLPERELKGKKGEKRK